MDITQTENYLTNITNTINSINMSQINIAMNTGESDSKLDATKKKFGSLSSEASKFATLAGDALIGFAQTAFDAAAQANGIDLKGKFDELQSTWTELSAVIAAPLLEPLIDMLAIAGEGLQQFTLFLQENPPLLYALVTAVGALTIALGAMMVVSSLAGALSLLTNPIFLIVAGISALIIGFTLAYQNSEIFREIVDGVINFLLGILGVFVDYIKNIPAAFSGMVEGAQLVLAGLVTFIGGFVETIFQFFNWLISGLAQFFQSIPVFIGNMVNAAKQLFADFLNGVQNVFTLVTGAVGNMLSAGSELMNNLISGMGNKLSEAGNKAKEIAQAVIQAVTDFASNMINAGKDFVGGFITGIGESISGVVKKAKELASSALDAVKGFLHIASPSKVMIQMGEWTGEGFENGLGSMIEPVSIMSERLAKAAVIDEAKVNDLSGLLDKDMLQKLPSLSLDAQLRYSNITPGKVIDKYVNSENPKKEKQQIPPIIFEATFVADGREIAKSTAKYMKPEIDRINRVDARLGGDRI